MGFAQFESPYDWDLLTKYKQEAARAPHGIVDLSVGSPVDPVPLSVQQALIEHADAANAHGYPRVIGTPALREAIARWFQRERGVDIASLGADIVPTVGSKEAVALMASLLHLGPSDVVVQPQVSYPTYAIGTQIAGASVVTVPDITDIDSWAHLEHLKAIWVNSPNNPTGEVIGLEDMARIVAAARARGAYVLSDECYALLTWQGDAPASCVLDERVTQGSADHIIMCYSLSKQSNIAGYRTAFLAGDERVIAEFVRYRKQIGEIIPGPVQAAMAAALDDAAAVRVQKERYRARLQRMVQALRSGGFDAHMPQGGLYVWVPSRSGDCWRDVEALAALGIVPSPGDFYNAPSYLRFSATASDEAIAALAQRLA